MDFRKQGNAKAMEGRKQQLKVIRDQMEEIRLQKLELIKGKMEEVRRQKQELLQQIKKKESELGNKTRKVNGRRSIQDYRSVHSRTIAGNIQAVSSCGKVRPTSILSEVEATKVQSTFNFCDSGKFQNSSGTVENVQTMYSFCDLVKCVSVRTAPSGLKKRLRDDVSNQIHGSCCKNFSGSLNKRTRFEDDMCQMLLKLAL